MKREDHIASYGPHVKQFINATGKGNSCVDNEWDVKALPLEAHSDSERGCEASELTHVVYFNPLLRSVKTPRISRLEVDMLCGTWRTVLYVFRIIKLFLVIRCVMAASREESKRCG